MLIIVCCLALPALLAACDMPGFSTSTPVAATPPAAPTGVGPAVPSVTSVTPADTPAPPPPINTAAPPTYTAVPPTNTPQPRALAGHVLDAYSGKPVGGARVAAGGSAATTQADGGYDLGIVGPGTKLQVAAPGYAAADLDSGSATSLNIALCPTSLHGRVTDAATGKPLFSALVRVDLVPTTPFTPNGSLPVLTGDLPQMHAMFAVSATPAPTTVLTGTTPGPPTATPTPPPVMPTPYADDKVILAVTDADGNYTLDNLPADPTLTFKMPGYKLAKVQAGKGASTDVALHPFVAKALYMTAGVATYDPLYKPILDLADKTEINAIVLNIQDDSARVVYNTKVPLAVSSRAINPVLPNIKDVIATLHKHNLYVIGRMVTFMQPAVADANPNLAVLSKATGKPFKSGDLAQQRWLDPTNPEARRYPLELAQEAAGLGFDEIQFDYIRFPSDPAAGETFAGMVFSHPADVDTKPQYIQTFVTEAHNMLNLTDAFMSVDIFGYTLWPDLNGYPRDAGLGQVFQKIVGGTDYVSPMIYPELFSADELGFPDPNSHPYEIIKQAGVYLDQLIAGQRARYRPWLQGYDWNHLAYDGHMYRLQITAAEETGAAGWMFWDPNNIYSGDGFKPK